jgi:ubiquinol-cytochrome c reductase iron-sulfur subunit
MAQDGNSGRELAAADQSDHGHERVGSPGTAVVTSDRVTDPGLPEHRKRVTDLDPKKNKRAERVVYTLFYLSIAGSVFAIAAYMAWPINPEDLMSVRMNNLFIGLGLTLALMGIGIGAVHWGKALMADHEGVDLRHPVRGSDATRERAVEIFAEANEESGFGRRALIRNSLIGALIAFPLPAVVLFRGLAPEGEDPVHLLNETAWEKGTRLARDPSGQPIKASEVTLGSVFHVIPEGLGDMPHMLEEKAKAIVLLMRLKPEDLVELPERKTGRTMALLPTRRSAPTWVARWLSMSSRPTTCSAPATSRSSMSPTTARSSSDRPLVPSRSFPSRSTTRVTSSPRATSTNLSGLASGSVIEYRNRPAHGH